MTTSDFVGIIEIVWYVIIGVWWAIFFCKSHKELHGSKGLWVVFAVNFLFWWAIMAWVFFWQDKKVNRKIKDDDNFPLHGDGSP